MSKEISQLAQALAPTAIDTLQDVMANGLKDSDRVAAANSILDRGYGKPTQAVIQIPPNKRQSAILAAMSDEDLVSIIEQKRLPRIGGSQNPVVVETRPHPTVAPASDPHGISDCYDEPFVDPLLE